MTQNLTSELVHRLELHAREAQDYPAFNSINLSGIKSFIAETLDLFGRNGIFAEYTKHNITHINKMLSIADWLIPEDTFLRMSKADSLMITLAI